jgi:hypothetical protein
MAIEFINPVTAGTVLVRDAIQSQNFLTQVAGWIIQANGNAEFNSLTIRGTFNGTNFVINSSGAFFYNGIPASGNLIASIASGAGTDAFGNTYLDGVVSYAASSYSEMRVGGFVAGLVTGGIPDAGNRGQLTMNGAGVFEIIGAQAVALPSSTRLRLTAGLSSISNVAPFSGEPTFSFSDALSISQISGAISGGLYKSDLSANPLSRINITPNTNWAQSNGAATTPNLTAYLDTNDNLVLFGTLHATAAMAAGNHQINLPANPLPATPINYIPNKLATHPGGMHTNSGNAWLAQVLITVLSTGVVQFNSNVAPAINDIFHIAATIPLHP